MIYWKKTMASEYQNFIDVMNVDAQFHRIGNLCKFKLPFVAHFGARWRTICFGWNSCCRLNRCQNTIMKKVQNEYRSIVLHSSLVLTSIIIGYCKGEIPIDCNKLDSITKDSEKRNGKSFGVFLATISMVLAHAEMKTNSAQRICTSISVNTEHLNGINTFDAKSKEQCIEITTWHELHTEWTHSALTIGIECIVYCKYIDGDMSKLLDSIHSKYPIDKKLSSTIITIISNDCWPSIEMHSFENSKHEFTSTREYQVLSGKPEFA